MSKLSVFALVIATSILSAASGGLAGYYAAMTVPAVASVAVLDVEEATSQLDLRTPEGVRAFELMTAKARDITEKLNAAGVVVLDRNAVISAPAESQIRLDLGPASTVAKPEQK